MNIDEFIERAQESAKKHRYHADFFDINNPMRAVCIKSAEDCEQLAEWLEKSKEYQHLEEQEKLVKLPCKVGDTVYGISMGKLISLTVNEISIFYMKGERVINVKCQNNDEFRNYVEREFGKTVFLTKTLIAFGIIGLTEVVLAWYNIRGRDKTDDEIQEQWCSENIKH